jgi:polyisoprenoid-binding protein YceI
VNRSVAALVVLAGLVSCACGRQDTAGQRSPDPQHTQVAAGASSGPAPGPRTFVIVPEESKASYVADEEFLAGAFAKLGIQAGKIQAVGTTHAIEGRFQLDPAHPTTSPGENTFTVRMNTFTTNQPRRDKWIREEGPRFDAYPVATFKATAIEADGGAGSAQAPAAGTEFSFTLVGDMTIREITKPARFNVKARFAQDAMKGTATTRLLMSSFGIEQLDFYNTLTVADEFGIIVDFTARPEPGR